MNLLCSGFIKTVCWMTFVCYVKVLCYSGEDFIENVVWTIMVKKDVAVSIWFMYEDTEGVDLYVNAFKKGNVKVNEAYPVPLRNLTPQYWHRMDFIEGVDLTYNQFTVKIDGLQKWQAKKIYASQFATLVTKGPVHVSESEQNNDTDLRWIYIAALVVLLILSSLFNCYCCIRYCLNICHQCDSVTSVAKSSGKTDIPVRYVNENPVVDIAQKQPTDDEDIYEVVDENHLHAKGLNGANGVGLQDFQPYRVAPPVPVRPCVAYTNENMFQGATEDSERSCYSSENSLYEAVTK